MAISLDVEITGFDGRSNVLSDGDLVHEFSVSDLLRAAVVAGYPPLSKTPEDRRLRDWRLASLHLTLDAKRANGQTWLIQPDIWQRLDPSEKGSARLVMGNIITKLLTEQLLGTPFLAFLDRYWRVLQIAWPPGRRPDFIALGPNGKRLSVEAKGRQRRMSADSRASAKTQAEAVTEVLGSPITAHIVVQTYFSQRFLYANLHDPEPWGSLPIPTKTLVEDYYSPVEMLLEEAQRDIPGSLSARAESVDGVPLARVPAGDFMIGLQPEVRELLHRGHAEDLPDKMKVLAERFAHDKNLPTGRDGIILVPGASWSSLEQLSGGNNHRNKYEQ